MLYPASVRFLIVQGLPWDYPIQWLIGKPGTPVDVTGMAASFEIRERFQVTDTHLLRVTHADGITVADEGWITPALTAEQTASLPLGVFWGELEVGGTQLLRGPVEVTS